MYTLHTRSNYIFTFLKSLSVSTQVHHVTDYELHDSKHPRYAKVKVKQSLYRPGQALRVPEVEAPRFNDSRHIKVIGLSALCTGHLYNQEIFLVLISVRGWADPRAIVRPE